jgi:DNA-binding transcriptional MerR regulator
MQIGIVAKKIGLSVDAIRFYERNALLPRAARTEGGFRQYGESDVTWRLSRLFAGYRASDSNSARFELF